MNDDGLQDYRYIQQLIWEVCELTERSHPRLGLSPGFGAPRTQSASIQQCGRGLLEGWLPPLLAPFLNQCCAVHAMFLRFVVLSLHNAFVQPMRQDNPPPPRRRRLREPAFTGCVPTTMDPGFGTRIP